MPTDLVLFYGLSPLFDRLMRQEEGFSLPVPREARNRRFPPVQLLEDDASLRLYACIPGAAPERLHLDLKPHTLVIRGCLPAPRGTRLRVERPAGPFCRDIALPCTVTAEGAHAVMRDGVLAVTLPKAAPATTKRAIPITCVQEDAP